MPLSNGQKKILLLTGCTGYVGGRLLNRLAHSGSSDEYQLRCLARAPQNIKLLKGSVAELCSGDLLKPDTLVSAFQGVHTAVYLVHALGEQSGFSQVEDQAAINFAQAAREAGVKKIVYLGGLGSGPKLSPHLASRQNTGQLLKRSGAAVIELRASIILGSGSLSFELIRSLTEKLPVMITPRWVYSKTQPIAIRNVLDYLVAAIKKDFDTSQIFEIGGSDQVSYGELMQEYARKRGLKRIMIPVPVLTPALSSLWLGLVTPVYARIGRKLVDGLKNDTVVRDNRALKVFDIKPLDVQSSMALAIAKEDQHLAETHWYDALSSIGKRRSWGGVRFRSRIIDLQEREVPLDYKTLFAPVQRIGGATGWYYGDYLWQIRGVIDLLLGGVGMRRHRAHQSKVNIGDVIDCWRVEAFEEHSLLRLRAEMKLPGRAWLQFEVTPKGKQSLIRQTAMFDPLGLGGLLYWYLLYPAHAFIFRGMLNGICQAAENEQNAQRT